MTGRLTGNKHAHKTRASIHGLMRPAGRDLESFTSAQHVIVKFHFERQLTFQHEEELVSMNV